MKFISVKGIVFIAVPFFILLFSQKIYSQNKSAGEDKSDFHLYTYITKESPLQTQVFTSKDIEESCAVSLTDFLQSSGMQLLSYGTYGLESKPSIRGFTDETVRVVIDGVCVNNSQYGTFDFSSFDLSNVEKIEIVRGGFTSSVNSEGAVGGTIYITTKKQSLENKLTFNLSLKTFFNQSVPVDGLFQNISYKGKVADSSFLSMALKLNHAENRHFYTYGSKKIREREHSDVTDSNLNLFYCTYFGNANCFSLSNDLYSGAKNCPGKAYGENQGTQQDLDNRLTLRLESPEVFNFVSLENTLSYLTYHRLFDAAKEHSKHKLDTIKFSSSAKTCNLKRIEQSLGINFNCDFLDSTNDGNHDQFLFSMNETTKFFASKNIFVTVPLSFISCEKNFEVVPKLAVEFAFEKFGLMLDFYRMVQFPNMDDLYWVGEGFYGNPDLKAEDGIGGEIIFSLKKFYLPFEFCIFSNYYKNKIQWAGNTPQNIASAFYLGCNFYLTKSFLEERIILNLSCEYLYTRLLDKSKQMEYGNRIMWTPDLTFSVSSKFNFYGFVFTVEGNYMGKRYKSNANITFLKPYFLTNVSLVYNGIKNFTPYMRVENLFNVNYESVESYPMPSISLSLGIKSIL